MPNELMAYVKYIIKMEIEKFSISIFIIKLNEIQLLLDDFLVNIGSVPTCSVGNRISRLIIIGTTS